MQRRKVAGIAMTAAAVIALGGLTAGGAIAGPATYYLVEIAPNGGIGGCQSSTGNLTNVTQNTGTTAITIQCPSPKGFAWGRDLDTPDDAATTAALVDDGSEAELGWKQTGNNNSRGRKLGLGMRVADMRVKGTSLVFDDELASGFTSDYDEVGNGKFSKRPNLKLRLPKAADLQAGTARCTEEGETAGIRWTASVSGRGVAYRAYTPEVLIDCPGGSNANGRFRSNTVSMTPDPNSQKLMTGTASCLTGQAIAGGYDIAGSTTSQWPMIVLNGPDAPDVDGVSKTWRVTVAVPSQNSSAAKAILKVWVTCSGS